MPDNLKDAGTPETAGMLKSALGFAWLVFMSIWGGTASYIERVRKKDTPFSIIELVGEWVICGFSGIITAYLCVDANLTFYETAALTGIAGHLGGRGLFVIENYIKNKYFR